MSRRTFCLALAFLALPVGCGVGRILVGERFIVSTGSAGGAGGTGGSPLCVPETTQPCYDGPPGTEGQGICKAGVQTCADDGESWGPCQGEVLPQPENCATPEDEDCDGKAPACKGNLLWAEGFGDASDQIANAVTLDTAGNPIVTGSFSGMIDFGGGPLTSAGADDVFLIKLAPDGSHVWSKRFGDAGIQVGYAVATDGADNIVVVGAFSGTIDFGGGALTSAGGNDVFVAKFGPNGEHLWSKRFGGPSGQVAYAVALDPANNVFVLGGFHGSIDIGPDSYTSSGAPENDLFVAKLDPMGTPLWSRHPGLGGHVSNGGLAASSDGDVVLAASFTGTIDFGGGPLTSVGGTDVIVAKLDGAGNHVWSKRFGDAADQTAYAVALDGTNNVVVAGGFEGSLNFGVDLITSAGASDAFVLKLDSGGSYGWSQRFGDVNEQATTAIRVDTGGNVLLGGYMAGTVDFGGGPLPSAGSVDVFAAKLDSAGNHVWSKRFGGADDDQGRGIAVDDSGNAVVVGYFRGDVDFGSKTLIGTGGRDVFVAKLAP
jgi:hypothetical protein